MNKYEIRVFGMKHSGLHAIINWIATLFDKPIYFFNNCGYGFDPYRTGRTRGDRYGTLIEGIFEPLKMMKRWDDGRIEPIRRKWKNCIIYSYENSFIPYVSEKDPAGDHDKFVGQSEHIFDVLIIRDLYNWAASLFNFKNRNLKPELFDEHPDRMDWRNYKRREWLLRGWKTHAREFLGQTDHLREKKVCIFYNKWLNKKYRENIANECFGVPNNEISVDFVALGPKGSQFGDGIKYDGRAMEMDVKRRWLHFRDNDAFWKIFDKESRELNLRMLLKEVST